jgi:site-specific recombinase XerD
MTHKVSSSHGVAVLPKGPDGRYELVGDSSTLLTQANRFLEAAAARGLAPNTIRAYAFDLASIVRWAIDTGRAIEQLEEADLVSLIQAERSRDAKPSSINRRLTTVEGFYRFVTGQAIPRGKGVHVGTPNHRGRGYDRELGLHRVGPKDQRALRVKKPRPLVQPLRVDQVNEFLKTVRRYRDLALVYLMLLCGLRSCEVLRMTLDDINVERSTVRVRGKGDRERLLPLPQPVRTALAGYLRLERPRLCLTERVFVVLQGQRRGCPMTEEGLRSLFRRRRAQPALRNANPHRWRHTFGSDMARAGVRLPILKKLMGHAYPETTLNYINLSMDDIAEEYHRASSKIRERYER